MSTKLLETLKIINGTALWLQFHDERLNNSRRILFNASDRLVLKDWIQVPSHKGVYKCRIVYAETIESIEYSHYQTRNFQHFKLIEANNLTYDLKYLNRESLNSLFMQRGDADDILLIKQGFITDTSIANVAFWHNNKWFTPATPLLNGTTRERLLKGKQIVTTKIRVNDLKAFSKMAIMNALLGFYVVENWQLI